MVSTNVIARFSEDSGTDFSGESSSVTDLAEPEIILPFFEPEGRLSGSKLARAFRLCCVGLVLMFSSSEPMIIISADFGGVRVGVGREAEPKKECRVTVSPTGNAFPLLGLWKRDITWEGMVDVTGKATGDGALS